MYAIYMSLSKPRNDNFMILFLYIISCHGDNEITLTCDIGDQNTKLIFASKGTHDV